MAHKFTGEFYDEGDKYKMRGLRALPLMDREKQNQIPEEQIQFLSFVVLPATRILESILSNIDLSTDCMYVFCIEFLSRGVADVRVGKNRKINAPQVVIKGSKRGLMRTDY